VNKPLVDRIAKAILYEGYILYPYRPSAIKNRQRFNFGVIYPRVYSEMQASGDAWTMQTECLVVARASTECGVCVRFLRMVARSVRKAKVPRAGTFEIDDTNFEGVQELKVRGQAHRPWQEAVEEEIEVAEFRLSELASQPMQWPFRLSAIREREALRDEEEKIVGLIFREQKPLAGTIEYSAEQLEKDLYRLTIRISNTARIESREMLSREQALERALVSAHTILEVRDGEFVSLIDPPEEYRGFASSCHNVGCWPVLVGDKEQRDTILSSPIILYDYPEVAPESPGNLFDGAEIDEILSLRIMTMTDEEKAEMRECDERARQILERTENMPEEQWMKLHGVLHGLGPAKGEMP
jgi:hypothetical protein